MVSRKLSDRTRLAMLLVGAGALLLSLDAAAPALLAWAAAVALAVGWCVWLERHP